MKHTTSTVHQKQLPSVGPLDKRPTAEQRQFAEVIGRLLAKRWRQQSMPTVDKRRQPRHPLADV